MNNNESIIEYLNVLSSVFYELDKTLDDLTNISVSIAEKLESFNNLDFSKPQTLEKLPDVFTSKKLVVFMQIFFQLAEFDSKFNTPSKRKAKEFEELRILVKAVRSNLHKILDVNDK